MTTVPESDEGPTYDELSESSAVPLKPTKSPVKVIEVKQEEVKKEDVKKADVRKIDAKKVRKEKTRKEKTRKEKPSKSQLKTTKNDDTESSIEFVRPRHNNFGDMIRYQHHTRFYRGIDHQPDHPKFGTKVEFFDYYIYNSLMTLNFF